MSTIRVKLVQFIIHTLENLFFYPKLKNAYKNLQIANSPIIVDVGSNKGQSIEFFKDIFSNACIYGFEPNSKLYDCLADQYRNNPSIHLVNKGVSDQNGTKKFNINLLDETSSFEELNYDSKYLKTKAKVLGVNEKEIITNSHKVEVIMLSSFIHHQKIAKVDILKIDVEGHEYPCLVGLFMEENDVLPEYIQLENHKDDMYHNKYDFSLIENLLFKHGYEKVNEIAHIW